MCLFLIQRAEVGVLPDAFVGRACFGCSICAVTCEGTKASVRQRSPRLHPGAAQVEDGDVVEVDAAHKCIQCGFPHSTGGTCLTAELMKRLIDQHGVLMRMMSKTEATVTRVSQTGGNADRLRPELETVATELARTRNEVITAVGTPKGRPPFHGAKTSGGSGICFKWRDNGKCAEHDKGSCRFDHPASRLKSAP